MTTRDSLFRCGLQNLNGLKQILYHLISKAVKISSGDSIVGKKLKGFDKTLYYEVSQHLTFLLQRRIKYEEVIQNKIKRLLKQGDLVFDIGANIGQYALPFSEMVGKTGRVVSFEPDYKNFSFLQFNTNINRCGNVTCENCGVGNSNAVLEFYRDTETGGRKGSFIKEYVGDNFKGFSEKVPLKKFETIISEYGVPNFVKVDVEGFESQVINELSVELKDCTFLIEVREETKKDIFNFFASKNYKCVWIDTADKVIEKEDDIPGFANLIFRNYM